MMRAGVVALFSWIGALIVTPAHSAAFKPWDIQFTAMADGRVVSCQQPLPALGRRGTVAQLADLRFYVSDLAVIGADGVITPIRLRPQPDWQVQERDASVALIDLVAGTASEGDTRAGCQGTAAINTRVWGDIPAQLQPVGLRFTLGVPARLNHSDQGAAVAITPAVVNNAVHPGMAWSWQGGRKFLRLELVPAPETPAWSVPLMSVHLGSTGCTWALNAQGQPQVGRLAQCTRPNRVTDIDVPLADPQRQQVALDLTALLAQLAIDQNQGGAPGCMSAADDPECAPLFAALGLSVQTGQVMAATPTPPVFRTIPIHQE